MICQSINVALSNTELPVGSFVEGLSSGATGFAVEAGGGGTTHDLEQVSGTFIVGEQIRINGDNSLTRSITTVTKFGLEDIMSVHQEDTFVSGADFSGDLVLKEVPIKELSPADRINKSGSNISVAHLEIHNLSGMIPNALLLNLVSFVHQV